MSKTPENCLRVTLLAEPYPKARSIFVVREERAAVSSLMEGWRRWGGAVALPAALAARLARDDLGRAVPISARTLHYRDRNGMKETPRTPRLWEVLPRTPTTTQLTIEGTMNGIPASAHVRKPSLSSPSLIGQAGDRSGGPSASPPALGPVGDRWLASMDALSSNLNVAAARHE